MSSKERIYKKKNKTYVKKARVLVLQKRKSVRFVLLCRLFSQSSPLHRNHGKCSVSLSLYLSIWSFILLLLFGFREIYILEQETLRDSKLYCLVLSSLDHSREEPPWDLQVPLPRYTNACVNLIFYLELINFMYYSFKFNYLIMD